MKKRIVIITDLHYCHEMDYNADKYGGLTKDEKLARAMAQLREEYKKEPYEFILMLGDYSLDHWEWDTCGSWLTMHKSYTEDFVKKYLVDLPAPVYMIPGNHEQFGERAWYGITGRHRSCEVVLDGFLFILWDSYGADLDPTEHSDGTYTPPDVQRIRALMEEHPDKRVILCSHAFYPTGDPEEAALIRDERIVCLFQGHSHKSHVVTLPEEYGKKSVIHCGGWSHMTPQSTELLWGLREVILTDTGVSSRYIVTDHDLVYGGEPYHLCGGTYNEIEVLFK